MSFGGMTDARLEEIRSLAALGCEGSVAAEELREAVAEIDHLSKIVAACHKIVKRAREDEFWRLCDKQTRGETLTQKEVSWMLSSACDEPPRKKTLEETVRGIIEDHMDYGMESDDPVLLQLKEGLADKKED